MNLTLHEIAKQQAEWSNRNFPANTPLEPLLGIIEETGELSHAILKGRQGIRGTAEKHVAAERDAIGDIGIYLLDFANRTGTRLYEFPRKKIVGAEVAMEIFLKMARHVGLLADEFRRITTAPQSYNVDLIIQDLCRYSASRGWDFMEILNETWAHVSKRDWVADPVTATTEFN